MSITYSKFHCEGPKVGHGLCGRKAEMIVSRQEFDRHLRSDKCERCTKVLRPNAGPAILEDLMNTSFGRKSRR